jgi:glycine hydroxymethyltransferase
MEQIVEAVYPGQVTNHHIFRLPALGMCLLEMKQWGTEYADQIIANSQALGAAIQSKGLEVVSRMDASANRTRSS